MRHTITDYEFGQLKNFFDQNDLFNGASFLNELLNHWMEDLYKKDYNTEMLYHLPFECGEGIELSHDDQNTMNKPVLRFDKEYINWDEYAKTIDELLERISVLESMHNNDDTSLKHIPSIISTKEQWEEMKPEMKKKDRVLVHTTFDKALNVL